MKQLFSPNFARASAIPKGYVMANSGTAYFDSKGQFFKTPDEATASDLAGLLGRVGEGESLAPGIARIMLEKRGQIEKIFHDHDAMVDASSNDSVIEWPVISGQSGNVTSIR